MKKQSNRTASQLIGVLTRKEHDDLYKKVYRKVSVGYFSLLFKFGFFLALSFLLIFTERVFGLSANVMTPVLVIIVSVIFLSLLVSSLIIWSKSFFLSQIEGLTDENKIVIHGTPSKITDHCLSDKSRIVYEFKDFLSNYHYLIAVKRYQLTFNFFINRLLSTASLLCLVIALGIGPIGYWAILHFLILMFFNLSFINYQNENNRLLFLFDKYPELIAKHLPAEFKN